MRSQRRACANTLFLVGAVSSLATPVWAQESYAGSGPVVSLSGSVGIPLELADAVEDTAGFTASNLAGRSLTDEPALGFDLQLGYRFHPHFSANVRVEHLPELSTQLRRGRASPEAGSEILYGRSWALGADLKAFPWTGVFQPFALIGLGWFWADMNERAVLRSAPASSIEPRLVPIGVGIDTAQGFAFRAGGGLNYYLTGNFFLNLEASYLLSTGDAHRFDYVSAVWGFGTRF